MKKSKIYIDLRSARRCIESLENAGIRFKMIHSMEIHVDPDDLGEIVGLFSNYGIPGGDFKIE